MNENVDRCKGSEEYDRNTANMCHELHGHLFLRGTTYHDKSFDARCIKPGCGLNVNASLVDGELHVNESWE